MKIKRLLAFSLSMAMMISMVPALVLADETDSETTGTTVVETTEPKETEKPEPKETEKPEPKETEKPEPKETEELEPKETKKPEPAESEDNGDTPEESNETANVEGKIPSRSVSTPQKNALSGGCGDHLEWTLIGSTLTISGSGKMQDYGGDGQMYRAPWYNVSERIRYVKFSGNITSIGSYAFIACNNLTVITIPDGVNSIGTFAFAGCSSITSFTIPDSVTSIGNMAFENCSSLTSIEIPDGITSIGRDTFYWCESLKSIKIPKSVSSIGNDAFAGCKSLSSITIPDGVTAIGKSAFEYCESLKSIIIPRSVTSIGDKAFNNCSVLKDVYYYGTEDDWYGISIGNSNVPLTYATIYCNVPYENTLKVIGKTAKVKYKKLKKKKQTVSRSKMMTVSGAQGKLTYKILSVNKKKAYFKINASTGTVTVKKKLKKGKYTLKVRVTAAGNDVYKPVTKTVTFKIKVK